MTDFAGVDPEFARYRESRVVVLPVPFERTTSYRKGTADGPTAILTASHQVEYWEEELGAEPFRLGIATLPELAPSSADLEVCLEAIETECLRQLEAGKFLVVLGGEHGLTLAPVRAARRALGEVGVVQFDAHADLRESYEGTPFSHACIMRRILDEGLPTLAIGIRSLSRPESELIRERRLPVIWARELDGLDLETFRRELDRLPETVYLTFDVDYFDPALVPATGTPEPGGGLWYPTLDLLGELFRCKRVAAMDVVELAPLAGQPASDFLVARLIYTCLGFLQASPRTVSGPPPSRPRI